MQCLSTEVKNTTQLQARGHFTLILEYELYMIIVDEATVIVKCRAVIKHCPFTLLCVSV